MEGAQFTIGTTPRKSRERKKREKMAKVLLKRKKRKQKETTYVYYDCSYTLSNPIIIPTKRWLILPNIDSIAHIFLYNAGKNIVQIIKTISRKLAYEDKLKHPLLKIYRHIAIKNQRVRTALVKLVRCWIARRFRQGNDEDLVTGVEPVSPIVLTDWTTRTKYVFEPKTILNDMKTRLLMSQCTLFPRPKLPRNPYTNKDMSEGQFFSLVEQLRSRGLTHWALESLYSVGYNIHKFTYEMDTKLKTTILHGLFARHHDTTGISLVLDFIKEEHLYHNVSFDGELYRWALENIPLHYRISAWRTLCYRHYSNSTLIPSPDIEDMISSESALLCEEPTDIDECRKKILEKNHSQASSPLSL